MTEKLTTQQQPYSDDGSPKERAVILLKSGGDFLAEIVFTSTYVPDAIAWEGRIYNRTSAHDRYFMAAGMCKNLDPQQVTVCRKSNDLNCYEFLRDYRATDRA